MIRRIIFTVFICISGLFASHSYAGKLQEINILNGNILSETEVGPASALTGELGFNTLWVISGDGRVQKVNINGTVQAELNVGGSPTGITPFGVNTLWITNSDGTLHEVDISGSLNDEYTLGGSPADITPFGANTLWIANGNGTIQIFNIISGSVLQEFQVGGSPRALIGYGANTIWIANGAGSVQEINIFSGAILSDISVGGTPSDIIGFGINTIWVANNNGNLHKISTTSGSVQNINLGGPVTAVTGFGTSIWASTENGVLKEISPNTGDIINSFDIGGTPADITGYGANTIWVANSSNNTNPVPPVLNLTVVPDPILFGTVLTGSQTTTSQVTITNAGNVEISNLALVPDNNAFQINNLTTTDLAVGMSADFTVSFNAPDIPGTYETDIEVTFTGEGEQGLETLHAEAEVVVPEPDICLSNAVSINFGTINKGESTQRVLSVKNCGTRDLEIISLSLVPISGDNIWSLSQTAPPSFILSPDNLRNIAITANIPADIQQDTTYSALLTVESNDPDSPFVDVQVSVIGHIPVARIEVPPAYIDTDYRDVETGFRFSRPLVIRNTGDLQLEFKIVHEDITDPDTENFQLETDVPDNDGIFIIPPFSERVFRQTFEPVEVSEQEKSIVLRIENTNDETFTQLNLALHGRGIAPRPIDAVLVLDRSGSMSDSTGETIKIEALKNSAELFASLLRPGTDFLGLNQYNASSQNIVPLDSIENNLQPVNNALSALEPDGSTGIGNALQTASEQYGLSPVDADPAHRKIMVLLSDGIENQAPYINDVINGYGSYPGLFSEFPDLLTYSVGLGDADNINSDRLQEISNRGEGGFFHVTGPLSDLNVFALENFYFKVFADAIDHDMVVDPAFLVTPGQTLEIPVGIISEDREALFFFIGDLPESAYIFELVDPEGQVISSSATIGGMSVQVKQHNNWTWFRVLFPELDVSNKHIGTWIFRIRIESPEKWFKTEPGENNAYVGGYMNNGMHRMSVAASVKSNYKMDVSVQPETVLVGDKLLVQAKLTNGGWPAPDASVNVTITRPDGSVNQMKLNPSVEENEAGVFINAYTDTSLRGVYDFLFRSTGRTDRGEVVTREARISHFVGKPAEDPTKTPGKPPKQPTILIWIIIIMLGVIIFRMFCPTRQQRADKR